MVRRPATPARPAPSNCRRCTLTPSAAKRSTVVTTFDDVGAKAMELAHNEDVAGLQAILPALIIVGPLDDYPSSRGYLSKRSSQQTNGVALTSSCRVKNSFSNTWRMIIAMAAQ
jgi:hypothetical protein